MNEQMGLDGMPAASPDSEARQRSLTPAQRDILTHASQHDGIRPVGAGDIIHRHRSNGRRNAAGGYERCGFGAKGGFPTETACCPYAASDGYEAVKRLAERGVLVRGDDGRWRPA